MKPSNPTPATRFSAPPGRRAEVLPAVHLPARKVQLGALRRLQWRCNSTGPVAGAAEVLSGVEVLKVIERTPGKNTEKPYFTLNCKENCGFPEFFPGVL